MKITIFGSSGRTGLPLVHQALEAGHQVTAYLRDPNKLAIKHPNLRVIQGNINDLSGIEKAVAGQDAVLSTLGAVPGGAKDIMTVAAKNIIAAMQKTGVQRLITLTGAGVAQPGDQPKAINNLISFMLRFLAKEVQLDAAEHVRLVRASSLDWTIVRVPMLTNAPSSGQLKVGMVGINDGMRIGRSEVAAFMLKTLETGTHRKAAPVISA